VRRFTPVQSTRKTAAVAITSSPGYRPNSVKRLFVSADKIVDISALPDNG
jgi:hypothetical protein